MWGISWLAWIAKTCKEILLTFWPFPKYWHYQTPSLHWLPGRFKSSSGKLLWRLSAQMRPWTGAWRMQSIWLLRRPLQDNLESGVLFERRPQKHVQVQSCCITFTYTAHYSTMCQCRWAQRPIMTKQTTEQVHIIQVQVHTHQPCPGCISKI